MTTITMTIEEAKWWEAASEAWVAIRPMSWLGVQQ